MWIDKILLFNDHETRQTESQQPGSSLAIPSSEEENASSICYHRIKTHSIGGIDDLNEYPCKRVTRGLKNNSSTQPPSCFYFC